MIIKCDNCSVEFNREKSRQKYCQPCRDKNISHFVGHKICEACGNSFPSFSNGNRFCSRSCWYSTSRKFQLINCKSCGVEFKPKRERQLACSRLCAAKLAGITQVSRRKISICDVCGVEFFSKHKSTRVCSLGCRGVLRRVDPVYSKCLRCGIEMPWTRFRARKYCSVKCKKTPIGSLSNKNCGGYLNVMTESGWKLQHRHVMELSLGRPLIRTETVHHKNGNKTDNRIENLELFKGKHGRGIRTHDYHCAGCRCFEHMT